MVYRRINMNGFGLSKFAQEGIIEQNTPETSTTEEEKETIITCLSDCIYCQNPEKTCMLSNVTISSEGAGSFICGQYKGNEEEQAQAPAPAPAAPAAPAAPEAVQGEGPKAPEAKAPEATKEMGLSKVKKEAPVAPSAPEKKIGLEKVKKPATQGVPNV